MIIMPFVHVVNCSIGWKLNETGGLEPDWTDLPPAPKALLQFLSCGCKTGCTGGRCSCHRHNMVCTDVCSCASRPGDVECSNSREEPGLVPTTNENDDSDVGGE